MSQYKLRRITNTELCVIQLRRNTNTELGANKPRRNTNTELGVNIIYVRATTRTTSQYKLRKNATQNYKSI